ncbi:aminopeptidase P family protein [Photobacterium leiognathi]|uniref:M24 family metallopeptidase n=1 Tax=Photobacterium leiognathi TaxID=553611 RepID=UPI001EDE2DE0|nr:aminopeptidase P family protein [Photobacterium leiognathi]MCG3885524.1 aminopeptidase P family protein [Photobacterium leiognathi]
MKTFDLTPFSEQCDALLVSDCHNKRYLTDFAGSGGHVLITSNTKELLVPGKYVEQLKHQCHDYVVINCDELGFLACLEQRIAFHQIQYLGIEANSLSYSDFCYWERALTACLVPLQHTVELLRQTKTAAEVQRIEYACAITEKAIEQGLEAFYQGITETDLALHIEWAARRLGADSIDFLIVVSGERGAFPHGRPSAKTIEYGELVTIDFGIVYQGYHSDVTRTFCVGEISEKQQKIFDIVYKAQQLGVNMLATGVSTRAIDSAVREYISKCGYGDYFSHGLGHGVGLQGHEFPLLNQQQDAILQLGMVVTIEPGIYIPQFGGVRIEDTLVITANGAKSLTHLPRQLRDISRNFASPLLKEIVNEYSINDSAY